MEMPESEDARWVWYGGRPSLDFVNTRRRRHADPVEYLETPADLAAWATAARLVDGPGRIGADLLREARELREAIDALVMATIEDTAPAGTDVATVNAWLEPARDVAPRLEIRDGALVLREPGARRDVRHALAAIAADAARLLSDAGSMGSAGSTGSAVVAGDRARLRVCPGPNCGGRFLDASPAGRRRWCSMAVCGNRSKASRHRELSRP